MADSAHTYPTISSSQAAKEVTANQLILAGSANLLFGVDPRTTAGLNFGYLGGKYPKADGTILTVSDTTLALTASATNYIKETDGVVSVTTTAPGSWPGPLAGGAKALYEVTCNSATVTSYYDWRTPPRGADGAAGGIADGDYGDVTVSGTGTAIAIDANAVTYAKMQDVSAASKLLGRGAGAGSGDPQEITLGTGLSMSGTTLNASAGTGTVTSVAASVPAFLSVSGSPVTTSGTLAISYSGTALPVANGGTGDTSLTAYAPLFGGTTSTGAIQSGTVGTAGHVLTSNGAGALPTFQAVSAGTQPFDIHTFYPGIPTASAKLYRGKLARAVAFSANFSGAQFTASANATASTVFDIQKNGSSVGTCTIAAGGTTPTFASSGGAAVNFSAGDIFAVIAPASADLTLADPAITFAGTR